MAADPWTNDSQTSWLETFIELEPKAYLEQFRSENVRCDGRLDLLCRPTSIATSVLTQNAAGSALVKLGATQVLATVTLMIGQPSAETSLLGDLTVSVVSSESSQKSYGSVVGSWMQRVLVDSGLVDVSSLCIVPGKSAWRLQLVCCVLCDDGNVTDAALLAAVAGLQDTMLPSVTVDPTGTVRTAPEEERKPLQVDSTCIPIPLSIGWYKKNDSSELLPLVDPLEIESRHLIDTCITMVVIHDTKEIINLGQTGTLPLSSREIARAVTMAFGRAKEVTSLLRKL